MMRVVACLVVCGCLTGCASRETTGPLGRHDLIVHASAANAVHASTKALADLGYHLSAVDEAGGHVVADRDYPESGVRAYAQDPAGALMAHWWGLHVTLSVSIEPLGSTQTRITVRSSLTGRAEALTQGPQSALPSILPMQSNGTLERSLLRRIKWSLRGF